LAGEILDRTGLAKASNKPAPMSIKGKNLFLAREAKEKLLIECLVLVESIRLFTN
jgi:hypothetical protein